MRCLRENESAIRRKLAMAEPEVFDDIGLVLACFTFVLIRKHLYTSVDGGAIVGVSRVLRRTEAAVTLSERCRRVFAARHAICCYGRVVKGAAFGSF